MAQQNQEEEEELVAIVESVPESLDQSSSSSGPSLSRNVSFSKLNAQAPAFVPTRPQSQPQPPPRVTVIPPPPPPPAAMMHMYPPPSPFHVPIHSPVHLPHVIPVQNHHHHHNHHHNSHNHLHNHHQHHNQHQQYVPVRNHSQHNSKKVQQHSDEEVEVIGNKDAAASSDHASKSDSKSDEAMNKLLNQVEYYFSDLNLATTDHLMRFITKDPEGYVPISVVASFKKVKAAINSNSQLANILRNSTKLVVSDDGKKVRRQHPLTDSDVEELQSRIVVAENLPEDHCHQNLMKIFSAVGSVKTIRTCPPQTSGGGASSASRSAKADGMHFSNKLHAFVEYETIEIAEKAVAELNDEGNWRSGLRVRLMLKRGSKSTQARGKKGHDGQGHSEEDEISGTEQMPNDKQTEDLSQQHDAHSHEHSQGEDHANEKESARFSPHNHTSPCTRTHQIGALLLIATTFFLTRLFDQAFPTCPPSSLNNDHSSPNVVHVSDGGSLSWPQRGYGSHLSLKIYVYEEDEIDGLKELLRGRDGKISADACLKGQWGTQVKIHGLLLESRFRTRKKEEADLFFVPAYVKCVRMMGGLNDKEINHTYVKVLSQMPYFRRSGGRDHIFVFPSGAGAHLFRSWATYINRSIILTPEADRTDKKDTNAFNTWKDIIIPGNVEDGMTKRGVAMVQPLTLSKRKYLANYLGRAQGKVGRLKLIELAKQYPDKS